MSKDFKNIFIVLVILFLSGCSEYDRAAKLEKDGNLTEASKSYKTYLSGNPKDMVKVSNAQYALGVFFAKDGKQEDALLFLASATVSGYDAKLINSVVKDYVGDIKSEDFSKTREILNQIQSVDDVFKKYSIRQLQKLKDDENKAIKLLAKAKTEANKINLDKAKAILLNVNRLAAGSDLINTQEVEDIIGKNTVVYNERKTVRKYNEDRKNISYIFQGSSSDYKEYEGKITSILLKEIRGNNEFERRRDEAKIQKRYDDVLKKKFIYKFNARLPEYDFEIKAYDLTGKWGKSPLYCPSYLKFPPIKINNSVAEKLSNTRTSAKIEVIFKVRGVQSLSSADYKNYKFQMLAYSQPEGKYLFDKSPEAKQVALSEIINAKVTLAGKTVYLIK